MVDAPLPGGSLEALVVDDGEDGEPRAEGEEGLCCCGHAHRVRDIPGQGGFTYIQHAARGSTLGRTAAQNSLLCSSRVPCAGGPLCSTQVFVYLPGSE